MQIRYTDHALERLKERGITKKEVEQALKHGRSIGAPGDALKSTRKDPKKTLNVIYHIINPKSPVIVIVVTAYIE
jgi:Domain of unknown function (DUF4258)